MFLNFVKIITFHWIFFQLINIVESGQNLDSFAWSLWRAKILKTSSYSLDFVAPRPLDMKRMALVLFLLLPVLHKQLSWEIELTLQSQLCVYVGIFELSFLQVVVEFRNSIEQDNESLNHQSTSLPNSWYVASKTSYHDRTSFKWWDLHIIQLNQILNSTIN